MVVYRHKMNECHSGMRVPQNPRTRHHRDTSSSGLANCRSKHIGRVKDVARRLRAVSCRSTVKNASGGCPTRVLHRVNRLGKKKTASFGDVRSHKPWVKHCRWKKGFDSWKRQRPKEGGELSLETWFQGWKLLVEVKGRELRHYRGSL